MKKRWIVLGALAACAGGVFLFNASFFANPRGELTLLAHRGVHQRFRAEGLTNDTCTAERIYPPSHAFLENTLPSMRAAFDLGADMVEIDVHPTTDHDFAVFHDWTLDCRTDGHGVTREHSMGELRSLDVGFGYTADTGETFPFRGQGFGMMPSLREVLAAFPDQRFMINFKSRDAVEGEAMSAYLGETAGARPERLLFYGADPAFRLRELHPDWRIVTERTMKDCAASYMLRGWYGAMPEACRNTALFVPANYAAFAWGWPNRLLARMHDAGSEVYLAGPVPFGRRPVFTGIDDAEALARVPAHWRGGVSTDAIEAIAPLARQR
jgi:glycerophosphoryl diester phosphodiesterase